jgi:hypothetical protein
MADDGAATKRSATGSAVAGTTERTGRSTAHAERTGRSSAHAEHDAAAEVSDCVKIGDIVFLQSAVAEVPGLLFADGFVDESCWLGQARGDDDHELIMDSRFVISVKKFHVSADRFREAQKLDVSAMSLSEARNHSKAMEQLRKDVAAEEQDNELLLQRGLGTIVRFGDAIELKHLKSEKTLTLCRNQPGSAGHADSEESEAANDLVVSDIQSESQWFTVQPRFAIQHLSDPLRYGDSFALVSSSSSDQFVQANLECFADPAFDKEKGSVMHDVHTFRDVFAWKMGVFTKYTPEATVSIEGGEVVRLFHKEAGMFVATGDADGDDDGNDAGDIYLDTEDSGSYSFWRIELENQFSGSTAQYGDTIRLRHLLTQKYLCYSKTGADLEPPRAVGGVGLCSERGPGTLVVFQPVFATSGEMKYNCCVHLQLKSTGHFLHATSEIKSNRVRQVGTSDILQREDGYQVIQVEAEKTEMIGRAVALRTAVSRFLHVLKQPDAHIKLQLTVYNYQFMLKVLQDSAVLYDGKCETTWKNMMRKSQLLKLVTDVTISMWEKVASSRGSFNSADLEIVCELFDTAHELLHDGLRSNPGNTLHPNSPHPNPRTLKPKP